jgi:hypothetical protein
MSQQKVISLFKVFFLLSVVAFTLMKQKKVQVWITSSLENSKTSAEEKCSTFIEH